MRYILLIYGDEKLDADITPEQWDNVMEAHNAFSREAEERGFMRGGEALHSITQAKTLHVRPNGRFVTDGPFAETKEQLGGYYILECTLDEAVEMAHKLPMTDGCVEIRPIMEFN